MSAPTIFFAPEGESASQSRLVDWMNILSGFGSREFTIQKPAVAAAKNDRQRIPPPPQGNQDALLVLLPLLIVLSTFLFLLLVFLVCLLLFRKRRGISLRDGDAPVDMANEELIDGEGGFEGVESRWLESTDEGTRRAYLRAKDFQTQSPPNSMPTDITLSQFLAIQEKGVSAWSFEPDYETLPSLLVHSRTELTFLPDPSSSSSVQSNLPLPKLNEVYYWEVKMFDLPSATHVSVGLATKPYPSFRLPGHNRFSVAYHSTGDKSHNYPFTQATFGPVLKEGDVLGVGYRPRSGTVFFTRNGRKLEDAFVGLTKWNLFPTVGADGPCSVHVNLGQSGFVFIEANVKKWGLAPSVGTLAPPPAYGAERGSILLEAGGERRRATTPPPATDIPSGSLDTPLRRAHRPRRPKPSSAHPNLPAQPSPLRGPSVIPVPLTPPPPMTPVTEEAVALPADLERNNTEPNAHHSLISPSASSPSGSGNSSRSTSPTAARSRAPELQISSPSHDVDSSDSDSPHQSPNPPTPNHSDIHMHTISGRTTPTVTVTDRDAAALSPNFPPNATPPFAANQRSRRRDAATTRSRTSVATNALNRSQSAADGNANLSPTAGGREPPEYSPLDAYHYPDGVHVDLPADVIAAALEVPSRPVQSTNMSSSSSPGQQAPATNQLHGSRRRPRT